jgi:curli biogenesis system outer membrane secretion channel CsgG
MLRSELVKTRAFNVIERKNMEKVLAEHAFQQTGCTTDECAVKLGRMLNVQRLIVGSFGKLLSSYLVTVRVVDVETGSILFSDTVKGRDEDELIKQVRILSKSIAKAVR